MPNIQKTTRSSNVVESFEPQEQVPPPNLSTLPDLCLLSIFGHLPMNDLYCRVPLVCTRFADLKPVALAQRTHLTIMSPGLEREEVVEFLIAQQTREHLKPKKYNQGQQPQQLKEVQAATDEYDKANPRPQQSRSAIECSILRLRDRFHYLNRELDYLQVLPGQLPNLTSLSITFGEVEGDESHKREFGLEPEDIFDIIYQNQIDQQNNNNNYLENSRRARRAQIKQALRGRKDAGVTTLQQIAFIVRLFGNNTENENNNRNNIRSKHLTSLTIWTDIADYCGLYIPYGRQLATALQQALDQIVRQVNHLTILDGGQLRELNFRYRGWFEPNIPLEFPSTITEKDNNRTMFTLVTEWGEYCYRRHELILARGDVHLWPLVSVLESPVYRGGTEAERARFRLVSLPMWMGKDGEAMSGDFKRVTQLVSILRDRQQEEYELEV